VETFVVRVWVPADGVPGEPDPATIRGTVEHVRSGRCTPFRDHTELLALIRTHLGSDDAAWR
jgi:hypothetical protein